ncbi:uncharacterized protein MONBRDRAFT_8379 [Monosiga brevicollis MX1]|uniref:Uncharacterized protein n=1 Tax=Monosiga brevicollis TaxID=81824 RepID=A9V0M8_MONBE|nr:uncharacterized protein MONBRDRAFT_8379 [Monosiga brevicollis MX1]EDQ89045.1 predicted protein [Monosiga brevicollis MX1]|eukprot:XP_001746150.1 hypothetical protein [Monosiga brevicollis MX1]
MAGFHRVGHGSVRPTSGDSTPASLVAACALNDPTTAMDLLAKWPDQTQEAALAHADSVGNTALHMASRHGHAELVRQLVDLGADVNNKTYLNGQTPLHAACAKGRLEVVRYLLQLAAAGELPHEDVLAEAEEVDDFDEVEVGRPRPPSTPTHCLLLLDSCRVLSRHPLTALNLCLV